MGVRQANPSPRAKAMRKARERLARDGLCVNGANHGPAAPGCGGRCQVCADKRNKARRVTLDPAPDPAMT